MNTLGRRIVPRALLLAVGALASLAVSAADDGGMADHMAMPGSEHGNMSVSAGHGMAMPAQGQAMQGMSAGGMHMVIPATTRRIVSYTIPDIKMVREDGRIVSLPKEFDDGRPVVLTFIYTTCTEICPVITEIFAQLQRKLGPEASRVHMASITIDPEHDTPSRLAAYAKSFDAGPQWHYYTGTVAASDAVQRAFSVYHGDKMEHTPVTFLRATPGGTWVRYDGFATSDALLGEVHGMLASR